MHILTVCPNPEDDEGWEICGFTAALDGPLRLTICVSPYRKEAGLPLDFSLRSERASSEDDVQIRPTVGPLSANTGTTKQCEVVHAYTQIYTNTYKLLS